MSGREPRRLLILGGTGEAARLAREAQARFGEALHVTSSLAGRAAPPPELPGAVRIGGFGGAEGLADYLRTAGIGLLVDATHPFAARISRNARLAAEAAGIARLLLLRPPWQEKDGDRWIWAPDMAAAARLVRQFGRVALLTVGTRDLAAFAALEGVRLVARVMAPPPSPPLPGAELVIGRPPFGLDEERDLMHRHRIEVVIAKASGGDATAAKLEAARAAGIPVIMVARPPPEPGPSATSVEAAIEWIAREVEA